ncbi:MAG: YgaP family membrane protein [Elusimicrobiota bacterium]
MIKVNVGTWDRWFRVSVGVSAISLAFWGPRTPWAWLGLVPLLTGLFKYCPAYSVCGISTTQK